MKQFAKYTVLMLASAFALTACSDSDEAPRQPDFIVVGLEDPYTIQMGELFEISVPEEKDVENYLWVLPEILNVVEGANTDRLMVAGLAEGVIPAGVITVTTTNNAGSSAPRTLWKQITIMGLPPRPAYVQTSIVGSLTVDMDQEFSVYVPDDDQIASYQWSIPANMTIIDGGNTSRVIVKATQKSVNIPKDAIFVTTVSKTGVTEIHHFEKMICVLPLEGYTAKRYGDKTWMTVNLNYAGVDGSVGRTAPDDPDGTKYGRFYTWAEAMTGMSAGDNPYVFGSTGTDDANNSYTLNNTQASHGIQIQGICPEGWHVANAYDFYDLAAGIADDYGLRRNSVAELISTMSGIYLPNNREKAPMTAMNLTTYGFIGSYLRGSRPAAEGGLWANNSAAVDGGTMFNYAGNATWPAAKYPMYFSEEIEKIDFKILPSGQFNNSGVFANFGKYSYHWTATLIEGNKSYRYTLGGGNCNFSTGTEAGTANNLRCVANY